MEGLIRYQAIAVAERIRGGKKMKLQTVWTRAVVVIYLVAIVGACLYVPSHALTSGPSYSKPTGVSVGSGPTFASFEYRWVWNMAESYSQKVFGYDVKTNDFDVPEIWYYTTVASIDYKRIALEVVSLTAIAGALFLIGSFVGGRKRGKQSDPSTL